jgi:choline kinase
MKAIIFAAGFGRRLQDVTQGKPKWLLEKLGVTLDQN